VANSAIVQKLTILHMSFEWHIRPKKSHYFVIPSRAVTFELREERKDFTIGLVYIFFERREST
jgi:hypothetical protein